MKEEKTRGSSVQSVERSLSILEILAAKREPMTLGEVAKQCGLKPSTAHRLLATLVVRGFATQDVATGKYQLGLKTFQIGNAALYSLDLRSIARPHLSNLVAKCKETANLAVLSRTNVGFDLVYIDQVESASMVRTFARIGSPVPVHCTGSGKALLAYLDDREIDYLLKNTKLEKFTANTLTNSNEILSEIRTIRENGYSTDREETEIGVICFAAPIRDYSQRVVAAVSVSGPVSRMLPPYDDYINTVKDTAMGISRSLGYSPV
ncbi:MAG: IclR family transcriptional regulator [Acidobacteriota bacterium]